MAGLEMRVLHIMHEGELVPSEFTLMADYPFSLECRVPPWVGFLLARCDGIMTVLDHLEYCK